MTAFTMLGCSGSAEISSAAVEDLAGLRKQALDLQDEQITRRRQLLAIEEQIAAARTELVESRQQAHASACAARKARIDAEVATRRMQCQKARAEQSRCHARNAEDRADGMVGGGLLGAGLALVTGGSSLLLTAGGMVVGGSGGGRRCARPSCETSEGRLRTIVERELTEELDCPEPRDSTVLAANHTAYPSSSVRTRYSAGKRSKVSRRTAKTKKKQQARRAARDHERRMLRWQRMGAVKGRTSEKRPRATAGGSWPGNDGC